MRPSSASDRIFAFDVLRASAMQLGIVYHVANFYSVDPDEMWSVEKSHSVAFDIVFRVIHVIRMPLFFVLSGFFASLTYERRGANGFLRARRRRLLWPLLFSLLVINPIVVAMVAWIDGFSATLPEILAERGPKTGVYWFLYYLIIYSVFGVLGAQLWSSRRVPEVVRRAIDRVVVTRWALVVFGLPTTVIFACSSKWSDIGYGESYVPVPTVFLYYGCFFVFGWLLQKRRGALASMREHRIGYFALLVVAASAVVGLLRFEESAGHPLFAWLHRACALAYTVVAWSAVFSLIGFASHHLSPRPGAPPRPPRSLPLGRAVSYAVDASYWTYLVHLPIAIGLMWAGTRIALSCLVKAPLVMIGTSGIALATYAFVRPTWLGAMLGTHRRQISREPVAVAATQEEERS